MARPLRAPTSPTPTAPPVWLRELNFDPRFRAAAGMGTEIVRADQEALVASAWDQYEALRRANQLLRQMQLARAVSGATRTRQFAAVDSPGTLLQLTRPLHARIRLDSSSPLTLGAQVVVEPDRDRRAVGGVPAVRPARAVPSDARCLRAARLRASSSG